MNSFLLAISVVAAIALVCVSPVYGGSCLSSPNTCPSSAKTALACETYSVTLSCSGTTRISIFNANYGRTSKTVCNDGKFRSVNNVNCKNPSSLRMVTRLCEGKASCHLTASNEFFGGDPCEHTYKYLTVTYYCLENGQSSPKVGVVSENVRAQIDEIDLGILPADQELEFNAYFKIEFCATTASQIKEFKKPCKAINNLVKKPLKKSKKQW